ncbi:fatty acid desaturase family protein [Glutamicibacter creatinolyticus]|uniref:fatty acid desaturase family protein n=1 Tax=Glutamicibacter creatinolyticus TaxID=162496 RepID=UPI0037BFBC1F
MSSIASTLPTPPPATSVRPGDPKSFFHVKALVSDAGLNGRRRGHYLGMGLVLLGLLGGTITGFILLGDSWLQLLMAGALGILLTQFAFLAHEAAHRQILSSAKTNDKLGRLLANGVVGISYQWWMNKHNKHHATPNTVGKDPDIEWDTISFQPADAQRQKGLLKWITERQGYLFFPLLTLEGLNLHFQSIKYLFVAKRVKNRSREITVIVLRVAIYLALTFAFLPIGMAFAFIGVQLAVFGIYMGGSFAPNHKGMPMVPNNMRIDFFSRQVLTSRNVMAKSRWGNELLSIIYGGLNYQVEHHLFPSMPRANLAEVSRIVRAYCAEHQITYTVASVRQSYAQVIRYLNKVGLSARDPFDCPMVSAYRQF